MTAERTTIFWNQDGFRVVLCARFMAIANNYRARIRVVSFRGRDANGRSAMELMSLEVRAGEPIRIVAEGVEAEKALAALVTLVESRFGGVA